MRFASGVHSDRRRGVQHFQSTGPRKEEYEEGKVRMDSNKISVLSLRFGKCDVVCEVGGVPE